MHSSCRTVSRLLVLLLAPGALGACTLVGSQAPLPPPVPVEREPAPTGGTVPETEAVSLALTLDASKYRRVPHRNKRGKKYKKGRY